MLVSATQQRGGNPPVSALQAEHYFDLATSVCHRHEGVRVPTTGQFSTRDSTTSPEPGLPG
jgi:hypothetical protein